MTMPSHKNPCPGVMEFIILVGLFLVIIIIFTQFSDLFSRAKKKIFKVMHQFYTFYPKSMSPWSGWSRNFKLCVFLPHQEYIMF